MADFPLSYSAFTLNTVRRQFGLHLQAAYLFETVAPIMPSEWLSVMLKRAAGVALVSEKARSEFIVAPILLEIRSFLHETVSIYSGIRLDISPEEGLQGICDFILSKSPAVPALQAPLLMVVEAKKNDIEDGLGQCAAEMVAAQRFNQTEGVNKPVYGCVTTGELWQFLKLEEIELRIEPEKIYVEHIDKILGAMVKILA